MVYQYFFSKHIDAEKDRQRPEQLVDLVNSQTLQ